MHSGKQIINAIACQRGGGLFAKIYVANFPYFQNVHTSTCPQKSKTFVKLIIRFGKQRLPLSQCHSVSLLYSINAIHHNATIIK